MQSPLEWHPHVGQQWRFLASPAFEALYGGRAGPGKTECLLMESLRQIAHPQYTAIIFRRVFPSLETARGIIQRSLQWFPAYGGQYNDSKHVWKFPSGARIYFGHMQYDEDKRQYQGSEFCYIGFDELAEFEREQYMYMFTRCRVPAPGLRAYIRAASNPGGVGHDWVKARFITRDIVNQIRYFAAVDEKDILVDANYPNALSRAFYPAGLDDNPSADPNYAQRILATGDPVLIAQLLYGDWDAVETGSRVFPTFSTTENVTIEAEYKPGEDVWWGVDDGYVYGDGPGSLSYHPRVVLFMQRNTLGGVDVFNEIYVCEEVHQETIEGALKMPYPKPFNVQVDSSAAEFRGMLTRLGLPNSPASHKIEEGIKLVRRLCLDGNGVRLLRIHPRCENLIRDLVSYHYDEKGREKGGEILPLKNYSDGPDCLRYGVWWLRGRM